MCDTCVFSPECEMTAEDFKKRRWGGGGTQEIQRKGERQVKNVWNSKQYATAVMMSPSKRFYWEHEVIKKSLQWPQEGQQLFHFIRFSSTSAPTHRSTVLPTRHPIQISGELCDMHSNFPIWSSYNPSLGCPSRWFSLSVTLFCYFYKLLY